ncbi:hypothetical protein J6590_003775 [Homalodisca vitripennis]|nr:hypothetical protein J6590_003775 [Homalodisca vitripennis]
MFGNSFTNGRLTFLMPMDPLTDPIIFRPMTVLHFAITLLGQGRSFSDPGNNFETAAIVASDNLPSVCWWVVKHSSPVVVLCGWVSATGYTGQGLHPVFRSSTRDETTHAPFFLNNPRLTNVLQHVVEAKSSRIIPTLHPKAAKKTIGVWPIVVLCFVAVAISPRADQ